MDEDRKKEEKVEQIKENNFENKTPVPREKFAANPIQKNFDREEQESRQFTFNPHNNMENDHMTEMTGQMSQNITPMITKNREKIEQIGFGRLTDYGKVTPLMEDNNENHSKY